MADEGVRCCIFMRKIIIWVFCFLGIFLKGYMGLRLNHENGTGFLMDKSVVIDVPPRMVPLTLIQGAEAKGAVCLDGTPPGYHLDHGYGTGAKNWVVQLEGGGWCNNIRSCVFRKTTRRGSSRYMEKQLPFTGILSNNYADNPDFYNWNRVKIRYCDGASFTGENYDKVANLMFRGQRIWLVAMEELMLKGMHYAEKALLSGCSAGGLAVILHCDEFRALLPGSTKVKCLSDGGLFMDAVDIAGQHTMRSFFEGVVNSAGAWRNLPNSCTSKMDSTSCFFPQNLMSNIRTPLFILNAAYDAWQLQASLAPPSSDPHGNWLACKRNPGNCSPQQIGFLQGFRMSMLSAVTRDAGSPENGIFINSCFAHCQSERPDTWYAVDSPRVGNKRIAESVGDWFFDRGEIRETDCPFPCDKTCHNLIFSNFFTNSSIHY